jgi:4-amino-4-deoxy-L-arabinose transferase-like glycosyltransferase
VRQADAVAIAALGGLWLFAIAIIGIAGDFPLSDDWAYGRVVASYLETGHIERVSWTWAPIVTHVLTGAAFASLFGLSYETLRASTLLLGFGGVVAAYGMCRSLQLGALRSAVVAATLAVCPVYLNLAFTFMTDVPFTALVTASLALLCCGLRSHRAWPIALGCAAALAATLSRQPGAVVAVALVLAVGVTRIRSLRGLGIVAAASAAGALAVYGISQWMLADRDAGGDPIRLYLQVILRDSNIVFFLVTNALVSLCYAGFFALPVVALAVPRRLPRALWAASAVGATGVLLLLERLGQPFPPGVNVIHDFGLGAPTLAGLSHLPSAPQGFWWAGTWIGACSGLYLLGVLAIGLWERRAELLRSPEWLLLLLMPLGYLLPLWARMPFFDRYLTAVLPPILALVLLASASAPPTRLRQSALGIALAGLALFSVAGTRDYLEHHRVRAVLLERLAKEGIAPERIDGGFEFAGQENFGPNRRLFAANPRRWVSDDEYLLTYAQSAEGYDSLERIEYQRWMPPMRESVSLLHRRGPRAEAAPRR